MRTIENVEMPEDGGVAEDGIGFADWKGPVNEVLDHVDEQLKAFGLEIVMLPQGDDAYYWRIEKREA